MLVYLAEFHLSAYNESFVFYSVRYKWLAKMLVLVENYFIQTCNCSLGPPKAMSGTQNT